MFCEKCGSLIESSSGFCLKCGNKTQANHVGKTIVEPSRLEMFSNKAAKIGTIISNYNAVLSTLCEECEKVSDNPACKKLYDEIQSIISGIKHISDIIDEAMNCIKASEEPEYSMKFRCLSKLDEVLRTAEGVKDMLAFCAIEGNVINSRKKFDAIKYESEWLRCEITDFFKLSKNTFGQLDRPKSPLSAGNPQSNGNSAFSYGVKGAPKKGIIQRISNLFKKDKYADKKSFFETLDIPECSVASTDEHYDCTVSYGISERPDTIEMNSLELEDVQFSAIVNKRVARKEYIQVDIVMYEEEFRRIVETKITENNTESKREFCRIAPQSKIKVVLTSKGVEIDDSVEEGTWQGKYLDFNFLVYVPDDYPGKQMPLCATVYANDVIATKLKFVVNIGGEENGKTELEREDITSAFISYSSEDRIRVSSIVQGMKKARPDLDLFLDVESLRSGDDWESELKSEIDKRSIFYLCWSKAAKASKWVDFEWRYALTKKGEDFIEPIPIDPPELCVPPVELNKKHFNDKMVYVVKALEYMKRKKAYITVDESGISKKIHINKDRFIIGRNQNEVDIVISNPKVSRIHAEFINENGEYFIKDLGSVNKTYVNGKECKSGEKEPLEKDSVLMLGDAVIKFTVE